MKKFVSSMLSGVNKIGNTIMDQGEKNGQLYEKLNEHFINNIQISHVSDVFIIIITKEDKLYKFNKYDHTSHAISLCSEQSKVQSFIDDMYVPELSHKRIVNMKIVFKNLNFLTTDGKVYSWLFFIDKPIYRAELENQNIIDISCGYSHTIALTNDGRIYGWGHNRDKEICEVPNYPEIHTAIELNYSNGERITSVLCGSLHTLILTESGRVFGWGYNYYYQISLDTRASMFSPLYINKKSIVCIACSAYESYLLTNDGIIYLFGENMTKYLGKNTVNINKKIDSVYADPSFHKSLIFKADDEYYVLGKFGEQDIYEPLLTEFNCIEDVFMHYLNITYKPIVSKLSAISDVIFKDGIYGKNFKKLQLIGRGGNGKVYKVIQGETRIQAIKRIKLNYKINMNLINELVTCPIFKDMRSINIVSYKEVWIERYSLKTKNNYNSILFIQMEFCDTSLDYIIKAIRSNKQLFVNNTWTEVGFYLMCQIFHQILKGIQFLHSRKPQIIHRDLNPFNILIKFNKFYNSVVKIADFGLSTIHKALGQSHSSDTGHWKYIAPEVHFGNNYDTRADIYSTGKVCMDLFLKQNNECFPFNSRLKLLLQKLSNIQEIYAKMTAESVDNRFKSVEDILSLKSFWALNESDFDLKQSLKKIIYENYSQKVLNQTIYHIIGCRKLIEFLSEHILDIKNMITSEENIFIITNDNKFYNILRSKLYNVFTESSDKWINFQNLIRDSTVEKLCFKDIYDVKHISNTYCWISFSIHSVYFLTNNEIMETMKNANITEISVFGYEEIALLSESGSIHVWNYKSDKYSDRIKTEEFLKNEKLVSISGNYQFILGLTDMGNVYHILSDSIKPVHNYIIDRYFWDKPNNDLLQNFIDISFTKICSSYNHCLLLSKLGTIYAFGENPCGQLGLESNSVYFNIITIHEKFTDIAVHYNEQISIGITENCNLYVWGLSGGESLHYPKLSEFMNFNDVFIYYFDSDYNNYENRIKRHNQITLWDNQTSQIANREESWE